MTATLVLNFFWGVCGILGGYILGWVINNSHNGNEESAKDSTKDRSTRRLGTRNTRALAGLVLLLLVAYSAYLNYENAVDTEQNADDLRAQVECQRRFNEGYRSALQAQLDASALSDKAQKQFLASFRGGNVTEAQRTLIFNTYFTDLETADKLRNAYPLPVVNPCGNTLRVPSW